MDQIRPKTLNEVKRYKNCLRLKKYMPDIPYGFLKKVYYYLEKPENKVMLIAKSGILRFIRGGNEVEEVSPSFGTAENFESILFSNRSFDVKFPYVPSKQSGSGGWSGGDGGGANNNNNNNNNNNG